jgi:prevent-host-death family protein
MKTVNAHEAKSTLSALLAEVQRGEEVTIARNGQPIAKLVRITQPQSRIPGILHKAPGWQDFVYDRATR